MVTSGAAPGALVERKGLRQIRDAGDLSALVEEVLRRQPRAVADYKAGKKKAFNALLGGVMRETRGRADAALVRRLLEAKLRDAPDPEP